jgi:hypothetical protein
VRGSFGGQIKPFAVRDASDNVAPIPAVRGAAFEPRDSVESRCGAMAEGWAYLEPHVSANIG